jgi:hypothetical protein|tara:strand:+ start:109 stop:327 length:219 start_codon:yes stop_codon:yes gene_type:complete
MIKLFLLIILSFLTILISPAMAYFDPGVGAFIIQSILAFFAVLAVYLEYPTRVLKKIFSKFKKKKKDQDEVK